MRKQNVMHIVGNRPQFIKLAAVSREIRKRGLTEVIIHTGQHYDKNLSDIFFEELDITQPNENLGIGSGTHAEITGQAMIAIEKALVKYSPKSVILYGDTNSTLAGALAAVKLGIPIIHVEAGIRTGILNNPEESNRIVTDHLSEVLFCSDQYSYTNLINEGLKNKTYQVGDVMFDIFLQYKGVRQDVLLKKYNLQEDNYILMTWHRQENTQNQKRMLQIIEFLERIKYTIVFPMHPRTKRKLRECGLLNRLKAMSNVLLLEPIGYVEMINLMANAHIILTDSGGVSKESFFAGTKCLLMVNLKLWPDLVENHWILPLQFDDQVSITDALHFIEEKKPEKNLNHMTYYGTGNAAIKIVDILQEKKLI